MKWSARSPSRAEPLTATTSSDERSWRARTSAGTCTSRCTMTGTATSTRTPCASIAARVASASKVRCSTSVDDSSEPSARCAKPQAWNNGDATRVTSRWRSGMRSRSATSRIDAHRSGAGRALGPTGGPGGEQHEPTTRREQARHGAASSGVDQVVERRGVAVHVVGLGQHDRGRAELGDDRRSRPGLGDEGRDLFLCHHVGELRPGERGVEEHHVGAEPACRSDGLDERSAVGGQTPRPGRAPRPRSARARRRAPRSDR